MKVIDISFEDFFDFLGFNDPVDKEETKSLTDMDGDGSYFAVMPSGEFTTIEHVVKKPKQSYVSVEIQMPNGEVITKDLSPDHLFKNDGRSKKVRDTEFSPEIDTVYGKALVLGVYDEKKEDELYDISIGKPHYYIDDKGIIHHNSFVGLKVAKNAQKLDKDFIVIYIDTEMAFDFDFAESVGVDLDKLLVIQSNQIEDVQQQVMAISKEFSKEERSKVLMVIDSWGGLVTSKTVDNAITGNDAVDFTPAKKKNTFSKLLTGMGMTVFVINQVYACMIGDTKVKTDVGFKDIKELGVGDLVQTTDGLQEISKTVKYEDAIVYEIELEDGSVIECTGQHKFIVQGALGDPDATRWMTVENLEDGMELVSQGYLLEDPVNGKF